MAKQVSAAEAEKKARKAAYMKAYQERRKKLLAGGGGGGRKQERLESTPTASAVTLIVGAARVSISSEGSATVIRVERND